MSTKTKTSAPSKHAKKAPAKQPKAKPAPLHRAALSDDLYKLLTAANADVLKKPLTPATLHSILLAQQTPTAPAPAANGKTATPAAAPVAAIPDDAIANVPYRWFSPDECATHDSLRRLLVLTPTFKELLDLALQTAGVSSVNYPRAALIHAAKSTILEAMRSEAGAVNAAGLSDQRLAEAAEALKKAGEPISSGRLKGRTGTNGKAVVRWMLLHCPEALLNPPSRWADVPAPATAPKPSTPAAPAPISSSTK